MSDKAHFEKTLLLSLGHVAVLVAGFGIPVFLSRWLSVDHYGTYKQIMLLYAFALAVGHLGMDNGLFYFVKSHPGKEGVLSLNVIYVDTLLGTLFALALWLGSSPIAAAFNNPELAAYLPLAGLYVGLSLPSQHFEHLLAVLDEIKHAIGVGLVVEALKAGVILGGFYGWNLTTVLWGLVGLSAFKLLWLVAFNLHRARKAHCGLSEGGVYLWDQIRFGLPQGGANLIAAALKLDKIVIGTLFSVRQFTLYTVGCFEIPLIGSVSNTMTDLMSFDQVEARRRGEMETVRDLWRRTLRKVSLLHLPAAAFLLVFAEPVIVLIFSETYRESAAYFQIFTLVTLLTGYSPMILFRVFNRTPELLRLQCVSAVLTVAAVLGLALKWGPLGALWGKLLADALSLALLSHRARALLETDWRGYLPWGQMGGVAALGLGAAGVCWWGTELFLQAPLPRLTVAGAAFGMLFLAGAVPTRLVKPDEVAYVKARLSGWVPLRWRS